METTMKPIRIPAGWTPEQTDAVFDLVYAILEALSNQYPEPELLPDFSIYDLEEVGVVAEGEQ